MFVYPFEYMDDWVNLTKHYVSLNMPDITDVDYKLWKDFEINNLYEYMICTFKVMHQD